MIGQIARSMGAILVGFVPAACFIVGVEGLNSILYPPPAGVDLRDIEVCRAFVAQLPAGVFLLAATGWAIGTFLSSWLATRLGSGRHLAHGIIVGLILLSAAVMNMAMLPYPSWFWIVNLIAFPCCTYLGSNLGRARGKPPPLQIGPDETRLQI